MKYKMVLFRSEARGKTSKGATAFPNAAMSRESAEMQEERHGIKGRYLD